jgi:hypothetical protein
MPTTPNLVITTITQGMIEQEAAMTQIAVDLENKLSEPKTVAVDNTNATTIPRDDPTGGAIDRSAIILTDGAPAPTAPVDVTVPVEKWGELIIDNRMSQDANVSRTGQAVPILVQAGTVQKIYSDGVNTIAVGGASGGTGSASVDWKDSVRAASVADVVIATALENGDSIDGVTLATGDRVLLKNQTAAAENGVYVVVASGAASRSADANSDAEVTPGFAVFVSEGTANADKNFQLTTNAPITLDTTALVFDEFAGGAGGGGTTLNFLGGAGLPEFKGAMVQQNGDRNTINMSGAGQDMLFGTSRFDTKFDPKDGGLEQRFWLGVNATFIDANVTVGTDQVTETGHGFVTGEGPVLLSTTGVLPAGLATATKYWIIRVDDNEIQFATSRANAIAGTQVDITAAAGGGTHTIETEDAFCIPANVTKVSLSGQVRLGSLAASSESVSLRMRLDGAASTPEISTQVEGAEHLSGFANIQTSVEALAVTPGQRVKFNVLSPETTADIVAAATFMSIGVVETTAEADDPNPWKKAVRAASTTNVAVATGLENLDVVDGVTLATGDRVLLKNQTAAEENGIYVAVASGAASRAPDANSDADVTPGLAVFVAEGTDNAGKNFQLTTAEPITLDTTSLTFAEFAGAGGGGGGGGALEFMKRLDATGQSEFDLVFDPTNFDHYVIKLGNVIPSTTSGSVQLTTSGDGGANFDTGASDYQRNAYGRDDAGAGNSIESNGTSAAANIDSFYGFGGDAGEDGISGEIWIYAPDQAKRTFIQGQLTGINNLGEATTITFGGYRNEAAAADAIRLVLSGSNISSGIITAYGVRKNATAGSSGGEVLALDSRITGQVISSEFLEFDFPTDAQFMEVAIDGLFWNASLLGDSLTMRFSDDGGTTFESAASDYSYGRKGTTDAAGDGDGGAATASHVDLGLLQDAITSALEGVHGKIIFQRIGDAISFNAQLGWGAAVMTTSGHFVGTPANPINRIQLFAATAGTASGVALGTLPTDVIRGFTYLQKTASGSATIDFDANNDGIIFSLYDRFEVEFEDVASATNIVDFDMRASTDGGTTFLAGTNYKFANNRWGPSTSGLLTQGTSNAEIQFIRGIGNAAGEGAHGIIKMGNLNGPLEKGVNWDASHHEHSSIELRWTGIGQILTTSPINGLRFLMTTGNIATGKFTLRGRRV